jgi:acyl dehydratase
MVLDKSVKGKICGPYANLFWERKIKQFMDAVGDNNPVYLNEEKAKEIGVKGKIAPPAFAATGALSFWGLVDAVKADEAKMLHGEQEFEFIRPIRAGDRIAISYEITDVYERKGMTFAEIKGTAVNPKGEEIYKARIVLLERG